MISRHVTTSGYQELEVQAGRYYLLTIKGTYTGTDPITLEFYNKDADSWFAVRDGSWHGPFDANGVEERVLAPDGPLRLSVPPDGTIDLWITLTPGLLRMSQWNENRDTDRDRNR